MFRYLLVIVSYSLFSEEAMMPEQRISITASYTFWLAREGGLATNYASIDLGIPTQDDITIGTPDPGATPVIGTPPGVGRPQDISTIGPPDTQNVEGPGNTLQSNPSSVGFPEISPRSGFKIEASYISDSWDLSFAYNWFNNMDNSYIAAMPPEDDTSSSSLSTWEIGDGAMGFFIEDELSSAWNNAFNRIDLSLGGDLCISYISIKPFLGLLFAWDEQSYQVSYGQSGVANSDTPMVVEWHNRQEWYGIGPYIGIVPSYILWNGNGHYIFICGKSGLSLAYSKANTKMNQFIGEAASTEKSIPMNTYRDIFYYLSPMVEASIGICWDGRYDGWSTMLSISWEIESWFSHNRMFNINHYPSSRGIYSMQGFTLTGGLGF